MKILRCELVVSELVMSELIVAKLIVGGKRISVIVAKIMGSDMGSELVTVAAHRVTSNSVCVRGVSRKAVSIATRPMPHVGQATMGSTRVKPTASAMPAATPAVKAGKSAAPAVKATASTPTAMPPAAATTSMPGDCRDVHDGAKRTNRNAGCQNTYCSLALHGALLPSTCASAAFRNAREPTRLNVTVVSAASFLDREPKVPY